MSNHNLTAVLYAPVQKFLDALPDSYYQNLLQVFEQHYLTMPYYCSQLFRTLHIFTTEFFISSLTVDT
ncbi:unnamed protein product [Leptidea sinapis]|uniref:Uncharacterized protein n=1 Tax=Leptidea sinapis TaxID=189913 RepID=A0A5E4PTU7_9NEOP|nr:unnamed protein product [Leptidea sinapis]